MNRVLKLVINYYTMYTIYLTVITSGSVPFLFNNPVNCKYQRSSISERTNQLNKLNLWPQPYRSRKPTTIIPPQRHHLPKTILFNLSSLCILLSTMCMVYVPKPLACDIKYVVFTHVTVTVDAIYGAFRQRQSLVWARWNRCAIKITHLKESLRYIFQMSCCFIIWVAK